MLEHRRSSLARSAVVAISSALVPLHAAQAPLTPDDDRDVMFAVTEQSIRPYVGLERELAGLPSGPVVVLPLSLPACAAAGGKPPTCATVEALRSPDDHGFVTGSWDYREGTRDALVQAFDARNDRSRRLPLDHISHLLAADDREAAQSTASVAPADLVIQLTLPGYTSHGFAIVYGQSTRSGRPLQGWAFVLTRASGRWTVQHAYLLWIRQ